VKKKNKTSKSYHKPSTTKTKTKTKKRKTKQKTKKSMHIRKTVKQKNNIFKNLLNI